MEAGEAAEGLGEVAVGARVVLGPTGAAEFPIEDGAVAAGIAAEAGFGVLGVHEAGEDPLGLLAKVGREFDVVVRFEGGVDAERTLLEGEQTGKEGEGAGHPTEAHDCNRG